MYSNTKGLKCESCKSNFSIYKYHNVSGLYFMYDSCVVTLCSFLLVINALNTCIYT